MNNFKILKFKFPRIINKHFKPNPGEVLIPVNNLFLKISVARLSKEEFLY